MTSRRKCPDPVQQHGAGAGIGSERVLTDTESYSHQSNLQSRYLMRRCGIGHRQASVIAALFFGENGR